MSSNKAFSRWGEVFGDDTVAAAMIDRLVHHAEVINLKGDSYRLKGRDLGRTPANNPTSGAAHRPSAITGEPQRGVKIQPVQGSQF
jgi:hypothetical protein